MTTTRRLWMGFGTLTVLLVLSSLVTSASLRSVAEPIRGGRIEAALQAIGRTERLEWLLLAICLVIAAVTVALVVRGIAQTERSLRRQTESLRVTISSIGDAVITTDSEGRIHSLNTVAAALTGWSPGDASGQPLERVFRIINELSRQPVENPVERVLDRGTIVGLANHTLLIAKDGTEHPIDDSAAPIRDDAGVVTGVVLVFRDVTAQRRNARRVSESEARKGAILETALDAIITMDATGKVVEFNPAAERMFGYESASVVGQEMAELIIPPALRQRHRAGLARYLETGEGPVLNRRIEISGLRSDGTEFPVELAITAIPTEGPPLFTGHLRDITERRRAEHLDRRFAAVIESSNDAIVGKDLRGIVTSWNKGAERVFGYTADEMIGQSITMLIPEELLAEESSIMERVQRRETIDHYETIRRRKDGTRVLISLTVSPIVDSSGAVVGASKIARDVSERRRAEEALRESELRFRTLADNMSQFAWTADAKGSIIWYNQRWFDYTGTSLEEMQGWGWTKTQHPEHVDRVVARIQRSFDTGEHWEDTFPIRGKDGEYRWFLSRALPIRDADGELQHWFGTHTDVSEQTRLADELRQVAADFSEADRRKSEFLAMLAHELRNPLAPIRNALQVLQLTGVPGDPGKSAIAMMDRQVSQMVRLIEDLLDVSRISRGKIELRTGAVELATVVNEAAEAARPLCDSLGHELTITMPQQAINLIADHARLSQVIGNLLSNACKFTNRGGRVQLVVEIDGRDVVLRVRDNGIGIAVEQLDSIFDLFTQVDSSLERSHGGLGIGLTLVKQLVEMHGGTVEARSDGLGKGSEFIVRLPIADAPPVRGALETSGSFRAAAGNQKALRILVVEDNRDSAESLALLLKRNGGHVVQLAHDGLEALEAAATFEPDVILLDIGLPRLNGYEVARRIRQSQGEKPLVLIALTGWGQEEDRRRSEDAGFDAHMIKPIEYATLSKLLRSRTGF